MTHRLSTLALLGLAFITGCSEPTMNLPEPGPVSGKLTLANGQPAKDVRVMLQPIEAMAPASGQVKSDGTFTLQTYDNKPGACPGKYRVVVRADQSGSPAQTKNSFLALKSIPMKYQEDNSPLEVTIPSGGTSDLQLKLDAK